MFEVKSGGYSIGITKYYKDAELWYSKVGTTLSAELLKINESGKKTVLRRRNWQGSGINAANFGSFSKLQSLTKSS